MVFILPTNPTEAHFLVGSYGVRDDTQTLSYGLTTTPYVLTDSSYEEIICVAMDGENYVVGYTIVLAVFRMNDNSLRLISGVWNWSTPEYDSVVEFSMRHVIYPDTPIIFTPATVRGFTGYISEDLVDPWLNMYVISYITSYDLEGGSPHSA